MSNSSLISYTKLSPNHSGKRNHVIDTITIHCMAGNLSVESCGALFASSSREASSNYGIGSDGRIALYVDEANRSWCTSSSANDNRAVTIEVANTVAADPWPCSDKAYAALLNLVTDICKRNGIKRLLWKADKNLIGKVDQQNMTAHRWFAAKACPGDWLYERCGAIAAEVNRRLGAAACPQPDPTPITPATTLKVGDTVDFTGSTHYTSSTGTRGSAAKAGKAKITRIATGAAHPYHLIAEAGGGSTVYGWCNVEDVKQATAVASYLVKVTATELNIRKGPGTDCGTNGSIKGGGIFTIIAESAGVGASKWGKLKSGAGWISLDYVQKL